MEMIRPTPVPNDTRVANNGDNSGQCKPTPQLTKSGLQGIANNGDRLLAETRIEATRNPRLTQAQMAHYRNLGGSDHQCGEVDAPPDVMLAVVVSSSSTPDPATADRSRGDFPSV